MITFAHVRERALPWLVPLAVLLVWEGCSRAGWLAARVLPEPLAVARAFWDQLRSGDLPVDVAVSASRA